MCVCVYAKNAIFAFTGCRGASPRSPDHYCVANSRYEFSSAAELHPLRKSARIHTHTIFNSLSSSHSLPLILAPLVDNLPWKDQEGRERERERGRRAIGKTSFGGAGRESDCDATTLVHENFYNVRCIALARSLPLIYTYIEDYSRVNQLRRKGYEMLYVYTPFSSRILRL